MRLLDTETGQFRWVEKPTDVAYAILSHVWETTGLGEPTYQDLLRIQKIPQTDRLSEPLFADEPILHKIMQACRIAREQGYRYLWVDTCCIDKTSSAELSEAINSMWEWYRLAGVCYAFLADVDPDEDFHAPGSQFRRSKWHTRGWTLQELIAPMYVLFLARDWSPLGTKSTLARTLEEVTGVDRAVLAHEKPLHTVSVAQRMCWASRRTTTRVEDAAYSLMGIFGINLPTIYGEGPRSFLRLQEEILRTIPDQSIFAWHHRHGYAHSDCLFASSPAYFSHSSKIRPISHRYFVERLGLGADVGIPTYNITSYGISARLPLIPNEIPSPNSTTALYEVFGHAARFQYLLVLECEDDTGGIVCLTLNPTRDPQSNNEFMVSAVETMSGRWDRMWYHSLGIYRDAITMRDIVVLHRPHLSLASPVAIPTFPTPSTSLLSDQGQVVPPSNPRIKVVLHDWCRTLLRKNHYDVSCSVSRADLNGVRAWMAFGRFGGEGYRFVLRSDHPRACPLVLISVVHFPFGLGPPRDIRIMVIYEDVALASADSDGLQWATEESSASEGESVLWTRHLVKTAEGSLQRISVSASKSAGPELVYHLSIEPETPDIVKPASPVYHRHRMSERRVRP